MTSAMIVPVIDVQNDNFKELWPAMVTAIKMASFVALDTELSGLGNRKSLLAESIEDRYKAICHAARTRSILSLGIACYKKLDKAADTYLVQVYNLTLLCSEEYIIEPQSVQFLVQHGFDFNKQYAHGIPYCKGNNKGGLDNHGVHIRTLYTELLRARKPLVLHNGLIDIAFLYQCFYAHLPERLDTFTADLSEMFPAGIYDTKYLTEFELRLTASYLEYAYKKCKLDNSRSVASEKPGRHVYVEFCQYPGTISSYVDFRACPAVVSADAKTEICERFSGFGWCPNGTQCPLSHDTDLIVLQDEVSKGDKRKRRKRKRDKKKEGDVVPEAKTCEDAPQSKMPHMEVDLAGGDVHQSAPPTDSGAPHDEGENVKMESDGNGVCEHNSESAQPAAAAAAAKSSNTEPNSGAEKGSTKEPQGQSDKKAETGTHRAGFDAFMTGYIFAYSCTLTEQEEACVTAEKEAEEEETWLASSLNKIYLSGKRAPLNIVKSTFAKSSKAHVQKMEMVWGGRK